MNDFVVVIPARFGSTRLQGKPLIEIAGKPMIQHVAESALRSQATAIAVASDDQRVLDAIRELPVQRFITSPEHTSGSDRVWEVARHMQLDEKAIVVNVQGDEPLIPSGVINQVATLLSKHPRAGAGTLWEPIKEAEEIFDPNVVKVVCDARDQALYFSRAPIPWERRSFPRRPDPCRTGQWKRHVGIYAFRHWCLEEYVGLPRSSLEDVESLEQLRLLENGLSIAVEEACEHIPSGVDTPEDLARIRQMLEAV